MEMMYAPRESGGSSARMRNVDSTYTPSNDKSPESFGLSTAVHFLWQDDLVDVPQALCDFLDVLLVAGSDNQD